MCSAIEKKQKNRNILSKEMGLPLKRAENILSQETGFLILKRAENVLSEETVFAIKKSSKSYFQKKRFLPRKRAEDIASEETASREQEVQFRKMNICKWPNVAVRLDSSWK